jgi:hypothetical protein
MHLLRQPVLYSGNLVVAKHTRRFLMPARLPSSLQVMTSSKKMKVERNLLPEQWLTRRQESQVRTFVTRELRLCSLSSRSPQLPPA